MIDTDVLLVVARFRENIQSQTSINFADQGVVLGIAKARQIII